MQASLLTNLSLLRIKNNAQLVFVNTGEATTYLSETMVDFNNATSENDKIWFIITQKYFTSTLQTGWRMYFDYLRIGVPNLPYEAPATPPTRWMYPNSKYTNNAENVSQAVQNQFGAGNNKIRELTWRLE